MIGKKHISAKNAPLYEVKEILSERNKEGDLTYEQQQAFDYSKKFSKITPAKGEKLREDLQSIDGLDDDLITKAVDILPADLNTAKLILYKGGPQVSDETLKQVVETVSKYTK
ncbi:Uncharacterised protein [uncultured archaeon]|nr:Uncharacterised protein [uncultured archaeon]